MVVKAVGNTLDQRPAGAAVWTQVNRHQRFSHGRRLIVEAKPRFPLLAEILFFQVRHDHYEPRFFVIASPTGRQHLADAMKALHGDSLLLEMIEALRCADRPRAPLELRA